MEIIETYLIMGKILVVADLHIGLECKFRDKGYSFPDQDKVLLKKIKKIQKDKNLEKIVILGDLKETITHFSDYEKIHVKKFMKELNKLFKKVIVVIGNHDGGIDKIVKNVFKFYIHKGTLFVHGHASIEKSFLEENDIKRIIIGHAHNILKIKDKGGGNFRYPCWVVGKYKDIETVIMPSFSDLVFGMNYVSPRPGPIAKHLEDREVFLCDLTKIE